MPHLVRLRVLALLLQRSALRRVALRLGRQPRLLALQVTGQAVGLGGGALPLRLQVALRQRQRGAVLGKLDGLRERGTMCGNCGLRSLSGS